MQPIPIERIRYDEQHPYRNTPLDYTTVWHYRERLRAGAVFPPITVTPHEEYYLIVDGYHRLCAYAAENHTHILCEVKHYNTPQERYIDSLRLNAQHGKPLAPIDIATIDLVAAEWEIDTNVILQVLEITPEYLERIRQRKRCTIEYNERNYPIAKFWEPYKQQLREHPELLRVARYSIGSTLPRIIQQLIALLTILPPEAILKYWDMLTSLHELLYQKLHHAYQQQQSKRTTRTNTTADN